MFQALVVQKMDKAIHWINLYPLNSAIGFPDTYPLDSDLSGGQCYPTFEQPGPGAVLREDAASVAGLILTVADGKVLRMHEGGQQFVIVARFDCPRDKEYDWLFRPRPQVSGYL